MPAAAVTIAGWVAVRLGSTTARVGRSRGWLIPVFTFSDEHVEHADGGALAAGAGGGGHGDERQQRVDRRGGLPDRRVDVVHQLAGVGQQQVDRLAGVDRRAAADRDHRVERAVLAGEADRVGHRLVGGLDVHPVVRRDVEAAVGHLVGDPGRVAGGGDARRRSPAAPVGRRSAAGRGRSRRTPPPELQRRRTVGEHGLAHGSPLGAGPPALHVPDGAATGHHRTSTRRRGRSTDR